MNLNIKSHVGWVKKTCPSASKLSIFCTEVNKPERKSTRLNETLTALKHTKKANF